MLEVHKALALLTLSAFVFIPSIPQAKASQAPSASSAGAKYIVTLSSAPNPPTWGRGTLEAVVTDAAGGPITDAQVLFDLDMTNMNMGKNIVAAVSQGEGRYIGQVRFSMPGPWRVIIRTIRPGQASEERRFDFNVKFR